MEFEWDRRKAAYNRREDGIAFEEALTVFADRLARIFEDPDHSEDELREILIGHSSASRLLVVSFTQRDDKIRVISARRATVRERSDYEENT